MSVRCRVCINAENNQRSSTHTPSVPGEKKKPKKKNHHPRSPAGLFSSPPIRGERGKKCLRGVHSEYKLSPHARIDTRVWRIFPFPIPSPPPPPASPRQPENIFLSKKVSRFSLSFLGFLIEAGDGLVFPFYFFFGFFPNLPPPPPGPSLRKLFFFFLAFGDGGKPATGPRSVPSHRASVPLNRCCPCIFFV